MYEKKVFITILNYNGAKDTIECLKSLLKVTYSNFNIVIIDNHSSDGSVVKMKIFMEGENINYKFFANPEDAMKYEGEIPLVSFIETNYNGGFGYGNNIGINFALKNKADYVLVLNNDTIVDPNFLTPLVDMCEKDRSIGIASGKIYYYDKPNILWFNGGKFNAITGKIEHVDFNKKDIGQLPFNNNTFVSGCMMLIPKEVIKDVGMFNEKYFMYVEDLELSQRVLKKGYRLKVCKKSRIWHKVGKSTGGNVSSFSIYWRTRNMNLFILKHSKKILLKLITLFLFNTRTLYRIIKSKKYKLILIQIKAIVNSICRFKHAS